MTRPVVSTCVVVFLFVAAWWDAADLRAGEAAPVRVVLRMDDMSARSDLTLETQIMDRLSRYGYSLTTGIIPFCTEGDEVDLDEQVTLWQNKATLVKQWAAQRTMEPALHGYLHRACSKTQTSRNSEFAGIAPAIQQAWLARGRTFLGELVGVPVTVFVPPFNTCDEATLRALQSCGFRILSSDHRIEPLEDGTLKYVPMTCFFSQLVGAVNAARGLGVRPTVIVALFHHYDFVEADPKRGSMSLDDFSARLLWLSRQPDVEVVSMQQLVEFDKPAFDARTLRAYRINRRRPPLVPSFAYAADARVMVSAEDARWLRHRPIGLSLAVYFAALLMAVMSSMIWLRLTGPRYRKSAWLALGLSVIGAVVFAVMMARGGAFSFISATALVGAAGLLAGGLADRHVARLKRDSRRDA